MAISTLKHDDNVYHGAAIQLPPRLPGSESKVKCIPTSIKAGCHMFRGVIRENLPKSILFLKRMKIIELKEIDGEGGKGRSGDRKDRQRFSGIEIAEENSRHTLTTIMQTTSFGDVSTRNCIIIHSSSVTTPHPLIWLVD